MNLFLKKLVDENKIKLTDPSDDICNAYLKKSENSMVSSKTLRDIGNYDDAVALTYYSMYYSALALLYACGIKSENHTGTIILLKEIIKLDHLPLEEAKKERVDKQYYIDFNVAREDVNQGITSAESFIQEMRLNIDRLSNGLKQEYREKLKEYIGKKEDE